MLWKAKTKKKNVFVTKNAFFYAVCISVDVVFRRKTRFNYFSWSFNNNKNAPLFFIIKTSIHLSIHPSIHLLFIHNHGLHIQVMQKYLNEYVVTDTVALLYPERNNLFRVPQIYSTTSRFSLLIRISCLHNMYSPFAICKAMSEKNQHLHVTMSCLYLVVRQCFCIFSAFLLSTPDIFTCFVE